jgi:hypothetical protein
MPSIHVTIAVVTGTGVRETSSQPLVRSLARVYPAGVAAVVLLTANHYVLDAVAGAGLGRVVLRTARWLDRLL